MVKCALDKDLNQTTKGTFFEYQQPQTYRLRTKPEIFRQCAGFKQFFQVPTRAPKYSFLFLLCLELQIPHKTKAQHIIANALCLRFASC